MANFKETCSFFGIKTKSFGDNIEINTKKVIFRNKILKLVLDTELRPSWQGKDYVRIFVPEIYETNDQRKVLAYFEFSNQKIPAILQTNKKVIFNFDPEKTIASLLYEKYFIKKRPIYTYLPFHYHKIPCRVFLNNLQTIVKKNFYKKKFPDWPIESSVETLRYLILKLANKKIQKKTFWPKNKKYAIALTHDVDTQTGFKNIPFLLKVEEKYGLTSLWNIVGHYYKIDYKYLDMLAKQGHEIGLHGFNHDNKLPFLKKTDIELRLQKCSELLQRYEIKGFRSPSLLRSDKLFEVLPKFFSYDSSIPDTEVYSPIGNNNGCCTVFPFIINGLVELPLTIPQDAVLLNLGYNPKKVYSIWINKLKWIKSVGGLAVINTHPEKHFSGNKIMSELYEDFIEEVIKDSEAWITNPYDIVKYWNKNQKNL